MGNRMYEKGYRYECKTVDFLNSITGVKAHRVTGSGKYGKFAKQLEGDVKVSIFGDEYRQCEVRERDKGFPKWIQDMLDKCGFVFLWKPRAEPYVVLSAEVFKELLEQKVYIDGGTKEVLDEST